MTKKRKKEELIDQAIEQDVDLQLDDDELTATDAVGEDILPEVDAAIPEPEAATVPIDPLTPPQPGMIPIGWMWPEETMVAAAMDTGDVEVAGLAPDAAPLVDDAVDGELLDDDEAEMIDEYRETTNSKFKGRKKLAKSEKEVVRQYRKWKEEQEEEDDDFGEPELPEEVELDIPPVEDEDITEEDVFEGEEDADDEEFLDEFEDIVLDINELFDDMGGDLDDVVDEILGGEDDDDDFVEDIGVEEEDFVEEDEDIVVAEEDLDEEDVEEFIERILKKKKKESIKYPAGDEKKEATFDEIERKVERRKEFIQKLRASKKKEASPQEIATKGNVDIDKLDDEIGHDSVQSVINKLGESKIKNNRRMKSYDQKFLEKFEEKKQLNWKKLLDDGLLG